MLGRFVQAWDSFWQFNGWMFASFFRTLDRHALMIITIGGVWSAWVCSGFYHENARIEDQLRRQQTELVSQLNIVEELRASRTRDTMDSLVKQCVHDYRVDGRLSELGLNLVAIQSLDPKIRNALGVFVREVSQDQGRLECGNPIPPALRQPVKITVHR